jgi:hypothetical protein
MSRFNFGVLVGIALCNIQTIVKVVKEVVGNE